MQSAHLVKERGTRQGICWVIFFPKNQITTVYPKKWIMKLCLAIHKVTVLCDTVIKLTLHFGQNLMNANVHR